ncbi:acetylcholinesterase [Rhipicephalus sanguineus]|uniref:acetylcholinesterase n=1 Tax=Rhipicephalus sanguineus TaxID=34632 RepID=UPI0020C3FC85|nr:acetylcholinesterase [Rhipicephalus sanguineus]
MTLPRYVHRVYDGAVLSSKADAVVAIPNYRLGLLGHATWNESEFLSLGLGDQLTAVRWLRQNVGFFGGNASRLVLAGHGAGAASVGHWMLGAQPEVADVQRFVMISGSPYARYMKDADVITKNMRILARRVQCESYDEVTSVEEILPCLRRFPSSVLVPRLSGLNGRLMDPSTSIDDTPAANEPNISRPRGSLLLGTTPDEGYHFVGRMAKQDGVSQEWMHRWLASQGVGNASVFLDNYQRDLRTTNLTVVWSEAYADVRYRCPVRRFAERMASSGLTVHWFVFDAKPSFEEPYLRGDEAGHYTTVRLLLTDIGNVRTTDEDIAIRDSFVRTLGSFANTGRVPRILSGKEWPSYTSSTRAAVRISRHGQVGVSMSQDPCRHVRQHEEEPTAATTTEASTSRAVAVQPRVWVSPVSPANTAPSSLQATTQPAQPEVWFDDDAFVRRRDNAVLIPDTVFELPDVVPHVHRAVSYNAKHAEFEEA